MSARWDVQPVARRMLVQDLPDVVSIENHIYEFPWTDGNFRDALRSGYDAAVVAFGGALVGYRVMMFGPGEAHLLNLSIAAGWQRRGWLTSDKQPVKNQDLWRLLMAAMAPHKIHWHWVKGHAGHAENERCDHLANQAVASGALAEDVGFEPSP